MTGKLILAAIVFSLGSSAFAQNASLVPYRQGNKWGYSTTDNKIVIEPKYDEANWFSEGMASVKIGSKYGYINTMGKLVIPAKFATVKPFRKGYVPNEGKAGGDSIVFAGASLTKDGYEICINAKGTRMPKCPAINENSVSENNSPIATQVIEKKYELPNNNGLFDKITDDYKIAGNSETYYIAVKDNRYGVFNSKFETIVPFEYSNIRINRNKVKPFLEVNKGGMFGIVHTDGKISIDPVYSNLRVVDGIDGNEYILVQKDNKTFVKDIENRDVISAGFANIDYDNGGFVITNDNNLKGYYFMNNNVIQPKYIDIKKLNGMDYLIVKTPGGKSGYVSSQGIEYFSE